ncbi:MAG: tRNA (N6-isopentenyl adenosine(37)-C2)-methylthiotransferase MiaB [Sphingosinicella sp.]|nr:tRNA (N6-isopentenyl adenosine(37)-C2)-methylthiotransferase MiaB [Sphingosinicella sp.]
MSDPRSYFVKTFGCQMNVYDSERMAELLEAEGHTPAASAEDADIVVLNTCHIRERASEKVYSEIGRLKHRDGPKPIVAVAGCVAQAEGAEIVRRAPAVDVVVGPQAYHRLPDLIARAKERPVETDLPTLEKFEALGKRRKAAPSSFLTIQEGCDKFCTYCVVPYTRGAEVSRPAAAILEEAQRLAGEGAREIVLLGQNVNAYRHDRTDFAALIAEVAAIEGIARIRYTTSHPADMTDALIDAHRTTPKLMPYLHLPVQSGSNRVLKAMNRSHTAETYLAIIEKLRAARADMAISGDFIVGFPGETEAEFEETLAIIRAANYAQAYSFKYSARPGTPAAEMDGQIDEDVKSDRLHRLQALVQEQQLAFNRAALGRTMPILLERPGKRDGQLIGKTPWLQSVYVDAAGTHIGDIVTVEIEGAFANSLAGRIAFAEAA